HRQVHLKGNGEFATGRDHCFQGLVDLRRLLPVNKYIHIYPSELHAHAVGVVKYRLSFQLRSAGSVVYAIFFLPKNDILFGFAGRKRHQNESCTNQAKPYVCFERWGILERNLHNLSVGIFSATHWMLLSSPEVYIGPLSHTNVTMLYHLSP